MKCKVCKSDMYLVPCPDAKPGCLVAHYACDKCTVSAPDEVAAAVICAHAEKMQAEGKDLEAAVYTIAALLVETNIRLSEMSEKLSRISVKLD